jgi:CDP-diacylglycerol--glycerol-3-phosphate 3-phosphatidyltransferase
MIPGYYWQAQPLPAKWYNAHVRLIDSIRNLFRVNIRHLARFLHRISGGRLSPNLVTIVGCVMHIPIAILIGMGGYNILAAVLLFVFGLFDTLDGELARLQNRSSAQGMLLDASTDRFKEFIIYTGVAYALATGEHPTLAALVVVACGASLSVSYVKAKGEAAVASANIPHGELNKLFKDGLLTFELRVFLVFAGLLVNQLAVVIGLIAVLASYTALQRLVRISKALT